MKPAQPKPPIAGAKGWELNELVRRRRLA